MILKEMNVSVKPVLWKPVGDELIFKAEVRRERDVQLLIEAWLKAMKQYELTSLDGEGLATKGGAFLATFPGPDSEVAIPIDPENESSDKEVEDLNREALASNSAEYLYDFFGPSIDTGFRVFSACSQRYFTLSLEAAWIFARASTSSSLGQYDGLIFMGSRSFKGVWHGREYPLFAIDRESEDHVHKQLRKLGADPHATAQQIEELAIACHNAENWTFKIYLPDSEISHFTTIPEDPESFPGNAMIGSESPAPPGDWGSEALPAMAATS